MHDGQLEEKLEINDLADNKTRFRYILEEMTTLHARKNTDYGSAFDHSLDEDGLLVSKIRMGDKMRRFSTLINSKAQVDDESMRDTLIDLANYAVMTIMWMDMQPKEDKDGVDRDGEA